jgi:heptosyltransferase I
MMQDSVTQKKFAAKKICLIRTSALGDTVHALALVNGLRKGYPDAHLTWILQTLPYEMVKYQKNIDRFIVFDRKGSLKSWRQLFKQIRQENFDLLLIPQVSAKVNLITMFSRAKVRIGFDMKRSRELHWLVTTHRIPPAPIGHVQDQFFEFLDYLEIKDYPVQWNFTFTDEELAGRKSFFNSFKRPAIGLVIASSHREKDWPVENYAKVIDYVDKTLDMQPMLIGGPSNLEKQRAEQICGLCSIPPFIALEKPIRKTMLQLSGSRLVISPDTGPLHMAVALNVPTIGLYGYSNPRRCGPYRKYQDLLIDKYNEPGEETAPITRETRPGRMKLIMPDEVIEKINYGLGKYSTS